MATKSGHVLSCGLEFFDNKSRNNTVQHVLEGLKSRFGVNQEGRFNFKFDIDRKSNQIYYHSYVPVNADLRI